MPLAPMRKQAAHAARVAVGEGGPPTFPASQPFNSRAYSNFSLAAGRAPPAKAKLHPALLSLVPWLMICGWLLTPNRTVK